MIEPGAPPCPPDEEAVHRLREESRLRIEQQRRWRAFAGWCAVATLAGGISLAALNARDARLREQDELAWAEEAARQERVARACAAREASLADIGAELQSNLTNARSEWESVFARNAAAVARAVAINAAADEGCGKRVPLPPPMDPPPPPIAPAKRPCLLWERGLFDPNAPPTCVAWTRSQIEARSRPRCGGTGEHLK